ncbi:DNA-binding transcriptional regulator, LysR family [Fodinibius roseus]|uniref:DNA-binding transcriptional regulator, LysR family n=1 Tax=Fodinibius roseus TaxID=1194090 RepID=A0A1M5M2P8_9BACT|nr:DNA-binding transcriptional regulator, LysR family [Fodinibius roseus]
MSYTKAARELYMSQPAITKNIQEFEQELGARLFNRKGNSIELTPAGKLAYSYSSDIDQLIQNLTYELGLMNETQAGNLCIGASSTISQYLIPPVIAHFKESYPQTSISLASGNTSEINTQLNDDLIDVGITEGHRKLKNFEYIPFKDDEIAFISHIDSPISIPDIFPKTTLSELPLVIRETGSGTREVFEKALKQLGLTLADLNILISLGSTESIKSFLPGSGAIGVFSTSAIRKGEQASFTFSYLKEYRIPRKFQFVIKHGSAHKLAREFIRFSKRHYNVSS